MVGLTDRQAVTLRFIEQHIAARGSSPSHQDIANAVGLKSKSGVTRILQALRQRGQIEDIRGRARTIQTTSIMCLTLAQTQRLRSVAGRRGIGARQLLDDILDQALDWREQARPG